MTRRTFLQFLALTAASAIPGIKALARKPVKSRVGYCENQITGEHWPVKELRINRQDAIFDQNGRFLAFPPETGVIRVKRLPLKIVGSWDDLPPLGGLHG